MFQFSISRCVTCGLDLTRLFHLLEKCPEQVAQARLHSLPGIRVNTRGYCRYCPDSTYLPRPCWRLRLCRCDSNLCLRLGLPASSSLQQRSHTVSRWPDRKLCLRDSISADRHFCDVLPSILHLLALCGQGPHLPSWEVCSCMNGAGQKFLGSFIVTVVGRYLPRPRPRRRDPDPMCV
jgi:hypothetical protein